MAEIESKELTVVRQQVSKAVTAATDLVIKTSEDMTKATDILSKIKTVGRMIKERKEAITKPLNEALSSARDLFKPIELSQSEAERIIKGKMLDFQDAEEARVSAAKNKVIGQVEAGKISLEKGVAKMEKIGEVKNVTQGKVGQVQTRTLTKYRVIDETLVPREYLVPDMGKISEAIKAGKVVPGAESYTEKVISAR